MEKILWMNSGGKDSAYVIAKFELENNNIEIYPFLLETDYFESNFSANNLAISRNMELIKIPYKETRRAIAATNSSATVFWAMECHYRALQYSLENGCDTILSGSTNIYASMGETSEEFEILLEELQEFLEVPLDKKVNLMRPIKEKIYRDIRYSEFDKEDIII